MIKLIATDIDGTLLADGTLKINPEYYDVIKELRKNYPESNIIAVDYDPGASEVNQLNRIKLMLSTANKNLKKDTLN